MLNLSAAMMVGLIAGSLSTWSFVPQIRKMWTEGETEAISIRMFATRAFGLALWTIYGFGVGSLPVMTFSALNLALSVTILVLKLRSPPREYEFVQADGSGRASAP